MADDTGVTRTAFISGPLDATDEYFTLYYKDAIDGAIQAGHRFVVGPVAGIDTLALAYLLAQKIEPGRVTVYMAHFEHAMPDLRRHFEDMGIGTKRVGDMGATTRDRDAKMTEDSDYDILRYRTEQEAKTQYGSGWWPRVSNTEMNERRRRGITSQSYRLADAGQDGPEQDLIKKESDRGKERFKHTMKSLFQKKP
jgi:hypothetical protein